MTSTSHPVSPKAYEEPGNKRDVDAASSGSEDESGRAEAELEMPDEELLKLSRA